MRAGKPFETQIGALNHPALCGWGAGPVLPVAQMQRADFGKVGHRVHAAVLGRHRQRRGGVELPVVAVPGALGQRAHPVAGLRERPIGAQVDGLQVLATGEQGRVLAAPARVDAPQIEGGTAGEPVEPVLDGDRGDVAREHETGNAGGGFCPGQFCPACVGALVIHFEILVVQALVVALEHLVQLVSQDAVGAVLGGLQHFVHRHGALVQHRQQAAAVVDAGAPVGGAAARPLVPRAEALLRFPGKPGGVSAFHPAPVPALPHGYAADVRGAQPGVVADAAVGKAAQVYFLRKAGAEHVAIGFHRLRLPAGNVQLPPLFGAGGLMVGALQAARFKIVLLEGAEEHLVEALHGPHVPSAQVEMAAGGFGEGAAHVAHRRRVPAG